MSHYKRSSWLDGLIEAERLYKEGWKIEYQEGLRIQFRHKSMDGPTMSFFSVEGRIDSDEFHKGCMDYVEHYIQNIWRG